MRDQYITELATTVNEMFAEGMDDPSAGEIARRHWGEGRTIPKAAIEDIRRKLSRVSEALREDGHLLCPLSEPYYRRFRKPGQIKSRDEARRCLAIGRGRQQVGLLRFTSADDERGLVWIEWAAIQVNQAAGRQRRAGGRLAIAVETEKLSLEQAREILAEGQRIAEITGLGTARAIEPPPSPDADSVGA